MKKLQNINKKAFNKSSLKSLKAQLKLIFSKRLLLNLKAFT